MLTDPLPFPAKRPRAYTEHTDEIRYDPEIHLQLDYPAQSWTLQEFGYDQDLISSCTSDVAVTSPFRILSERGIEVMRRILIDLQPFSSSAHGRAASFLAGGVYRSRFLRDFCNCPVVRGHLSEISGTRLAPHTMPSQQLYVNYAPDDITQAVDNWHFDGIGFDAVLMLSDPTKLNGGEFEFFKGTKFEIGRMFGLRTHEIRLGVTNALPADQVIQVEFPAAGFAIFQQGNMVVHRATRLKTPGERITMVPGYVALDSSLPDPTSKHDLPYYGDPAIVWELARHSAWLCRAKLKHFIEGCDPEVTSEDIEAALTEAIADISDTVNCLRHARQGGDRRHAPVSVKI